MINSEQARLKCGRCGVSGVRLYRPYRFFRDRDDDRCNACIDRDGDPYYVPLIVDVDGRAWGYTSVPASAEYDFFSLPESSTNHKYWESRTSRWLSPTGIPVAQETVRGDLLWWKGIGSMECLDFLRPHYDLIKGEFRWTVIFITLRGTLATCWLYESDLLLSKLDAIKYKLLRWTKWATTAMLIPLLLVLWG